MLLSFFVVFHPVYADGGWISPGGGAGGGGGDITPCNPTIQDCSCKFSYTQICYNGWSWIFYEYVGGEEMAGQKIEFRPNGQHPWNSSAQHPYYGVTDSSISGVCADPNKSGSGFWHLGRNAVSHYGYSNGKKDGATAFNSYWVEEVLNLYTLADQYRTPNGKHNNKDPYRFLIGYNKTGHMATFDGNILTQKGYWHLEMVPLASKLKGKGIDNTPQTLYVKKNGEWKKMYQASKSASSRVVLDEFADAYYSLYKEDYDKTQGFPSNLYAFCYWNDKYILTAKSVDVNGNSLAKVSGLEDRKSPETRENQAASVTHGSNSRYIFLGWKAVASADIFLSTEDTYTVEEIKQDTTVYAVYREKNSFEGQIKVTSGSAESSVGYTSENGKSTTLNIQDCDAVDGCKVTFGHNLKRDYGDDGTTYVISRTGVDPKDVLVSGTENFKNDSNQVVNPRRVYTDTVTMRPGQKVCETLSFNANDKSEAAKTVKVTACAVATGTVKTSLDINVLNKDVAKYSSYQKEIYAKPGDGINFKVDYNPGSQYAFSIVGGQLSDWKNAFNVSSALSSGTKIAELTNDHIYNNGDSDKKEVLLPGNNNYHTVQMAYVGNTITGTASTNTNNNIKTTPSEVVFNNESANIKTDSLTSAAKVSVPYNFNTAVTITSDENSVATAGSNKNVNYEIKIKPKKNSETTNGGDEEAYTTVVRNAKSRLITYSVGASGSSLRGGDYGADDLCGYFAGVSNCKVEDSEKSYSQIDVNLESGGTVNNSSTIVIADIDAGAKICAAAAFYPAYSGADTNLDAKGSNTWRISDSVCFTVGKKPTFQVWGGSLYGGEDVIVSSTAKNNLSLPSGNISLENNVVVFSSWVEQIVVAKGKVDKLASGASTGLTTKNAAEGGSLESREDFCKYRVPFSIANHGGDICPNRSLTGYSGVVLKSSKEALANIVPDDATHIDATHINSGTYYSGNGDLWGTNTINVSEDIYINGNIIYHNGPYTTLSEIPKMIIYTTKDIHVACGVTRVDAVLLAGGTVYTCDSYGGRDSTERANIDSRAGQLTINGAILTKGLELGRTYGMGTGIYSKIPAEIINYDSSIILWAKDKTDTEDFKKMHQVYINEIAPRY